MKADKNKNLFSYCYSRAAQNTLFRRRQETQASLRIGLKCKTEVFMRAASSVSQSDRERVS